jgi:recombination protein RecA
MAKEKKVPEKTSADAAPEKKLSDSQQFMGLLKGLKTKFGEDAGVILGKTDIKASIKWVPLSSPKVTDLFGGAGLPRGRQIEIFGLESSGKTSLVTYLAAQVQKHYFEDKGRFGNVAIVDAEHAFDPTFAKSFGLDLDKVIFTQPISGEEGLEQVRYFLESGLVDVIIVDSVDALQPQAIIDGNFGDSTIGAHARLMSGACRKFNGMMKPTDATILHTNQQRTAIGKWAPQGQVAYETPGGVALRFYASIRVEVKRGDVLYKKANFEDAYGLVSKLKCVKNKVGKPFRKVEITNIWGNGYDIGSEFFSYFRDHDLIRGSGWYTFDVPAASGSGEEIIKLQGEDKVQVYLKEHPDHLEYLKKKLFDQMTKTLTDIVIEDKPETGELPTTLEDEQDQDDEETATEPAVSRERTRPEPEKEQEILLTVFRGSRTEPPRILTDEEVASLSPGSVLKVPQQTFDQYLKEFEEMNLSPVEDLVPTVREETTLTLESLDQAVEKIESSFHEEIIESPMEDIVPEEVSPAIAVDSAASSSPGEETPGHKRYLIWKAKQAGKEKNKVSSVDDELPDEA